MKIETLYDLGSRFLVATVEYENLNYEYVKCEDCNYGIRLGPKGQKHNCQTCRYGNNAVDILGPGYVLKVEPETGARDQRTVIAITEVEVEKICIHDAGKGLYDVTYVYDSDYDGDLHVSEDMMYQTIEAAILSVMSDQSFEYRCTNLSPFGGVVFKNQITLVG